MVQEILATLPDRRRPMAEGVVRDLHRVAERMVGVKELEEQHGPPASWWYAKAEAGEIPSYKLGKYRRFKPSEIAAWIESQRQGPRPA
jgi:excisionase family DNA binding protein